MNGKKERRGLVAEEKRKRNARQRAAFEKKGKGRLVNMLELKEGEGITLRKGENLSSRPLEIEGGGGRKLFGLRRKGRGGLRRG